MDNLTEFDVAEYLDRIEYAGPLEPTLDTVDGILTAQLSHIPFENLDVVLGRGVALDIASITRKLVTARRGGYCFEQNRLLSTALSALGFDVTDLAARVVPPDSTAVQARSHMVLEVDLGGTPWLADAGFGAGSPLHPVPLDGTPVHERDRVYRIEPGAQQYVLRAYQDGHWDDCYSFTREVAHAADYEQANHFVSTHPSSPFVRTFTVQLATRGARHTLRNGEYRRRSGEVSEVRAIGAEELAGLLAAVFRLELGPHDLEPLLAWWYDAGQSPAQHRPPSSTTQATPAGVRSRRDILQLLDGYLPAAALGAAIERRLFWRLRDSAEPVDDLAAELDIPRGRFLHLCRLLAALGLLQLGDDGVALSAVARTELVGSFTPEGWAVYASDLLEGYPLGLNLTANLGHRGSLWPIVNPDRHPEDGSATNADRRGGRVTYVDRMAADPQRAEAFCRLLLDIHRPMAAELADTLDLDGVERVMDLGGGSGVVSFALLERHQDLRAVVVDIPTVCSAGARIAEEEQVGDRITFLPADFTTDELPGGFGLVLLCDVGIYGTSLFAKVAGSLQPGGRFVIVDRMIDDGRDLRFHDLVWCLREALCDEAFERTPVHRIVADLADAGFAVESTGTTAGGWVRIVAALADVDPVLRRVGASP